MRKLWMVFVLGSLLLTACGAGRVQIARERGSDVFNVTVELNEDDIALLVEGALAASANPLLRDPEVDLLDGQIEVTGVHERRDGGGDVNGRMVIVPSVQDGLLVVEVAELSIDGVDVSDTRIEQFNNNLEQRIGNRLEQRNRQISVTGVTVTDDLLILAFDASRSN
ncbi:MAG: hypothetical protein KC413_13900 [Anaerolineales bacterium]|nr:hypothetical protein [Anaerolineales bacterium]MCA9976848.1 hypothetical protein [Anaerolineales bacterium]